MNWPGEVRTGPSVVTIGVFDGVHRGHQRVLTRTVELARRRHASAIVCTFDPHPAAVVRPDKAPQLLTTLSRRTELFLELGVAEVLVVPFSEERSRQRAEEFCRELVGALHPVAIVVGDDFRFGYKAEGDVALLTRLGRELGFDLEALPRRTGTGKHWSSTAVRECLAAGDVAQARELLGRPFRFDGVVAPGSRRGRVMGIPTANVPADSAYVVPADGVYAGRLIRLDGGQDETARVAPSAPAPAKNQEAGGRREQPHDGGVALPAVISVGTNPQFGQESRRVEVHVLDRDDLDLYGVPVGVEFVARIRGQQTFDSVEALIAQEHHDIAEARHLLA